jgi:glycerate-2-kinase
MPAKRPIEGASREVGTVMAGIARSVRTHGLPVGAPAVLLSGGETTVTIGEGTAGRVSMHAGICPLMTATPISIRSTT